MVVVLEAYFDESALSGGGVYSIAGYAASARFWADCFEPAWKRVLQHAPHPISEFKASDCLQGRGEFSSKRGWTRLEREELTKQLAGIITDSAPNEDVLGYASVVAFPGFAPKDHHRSVEEHGYGFCALDVITTLALIGQSALEAGQQLQITFDHKPTFVRIATQFHERVKEHHGDQVANRVASIRFRSSHEVMAIQAADLLAYETQRETWSRMAGGTKPVSEVLSQLVQRRSHEAHVTTWHQMMEMQSMGPERLSGALDPRLRSMLLYRTGSPWRAPRHWPYGA